MSGMGLGLGSVGVLRHGIIAYCVSVLRIGMGLGLALAVGSVGIACPYCVLCIGMGLGLLAWLAYCVLRIRILYPMGVGLRIRWRIREYNQTEPKPSSAKGRERRTDGRAQY